MIAATIHSRLKWKKPTRSLIAFQEPATAMMPRKLVRMMSSRLSPSIARWKRMPSCGIQAWSISMSHAAVVGNAAHRPK